MNGGDVNHKNDITSDDSEASFHDAVDDGKSLEKENSAQNTYLEIEGETTEHKTIEKLGNNETIKVNDKNASPHNVSNGSMMLLTEQKTSLKTELSGDQLREKEPLDLQEDCHNTSLHCAMNTMENENQITNNFERNGDDNNNIVLKMKSEHTTVSEEIQGNKANSVKECVKITKDNKVDLQTLLTTDKTTEMVNSHVGEINSNKEPSNERNTDILETHLKDSCALVDDVNLSNADAMSKKSEKSKKKKSLTKKKNTTAGCDVDDDKKPKFGLTPEMIEEEKKLKEQQAIELNEIKEKVKLFLFSLFFLLFCR